MNIIRKIKGTLDQEAFCFVAQAAEKSQLKKSFNSLYIIDLDGQKIAVCMYGITPRYRLF